MRHKTKDKGDLGVAKTIPHLLAASIRVCLPLSEHLPFDLIAVMPDFTTLRRVQVKYRASWIRGAVLISLRSNYYDSKRIYSKRVNLEEIDCYAAYSPENGQMYYIRVDEIPDTAISLTLRFDPPLNGQKKGIRLANEFIDPHRIAAYDLKQPSIRREVSELDEIAVAHVITDLVEHEVQPFIPQSQYVPFDLIAVMPDMKTLKRVRVGWETVQPNPYIDLYAVYSPNTGTVRYIEAAEMASQQV